MLSSWRKHPVYVASLRTLRAAVAHPEVNPRIISEMQLFVLDTLVRYASRRARRRHTCRPRSESNRSTGEPVPICRGVIATFPVSLVPGTLVVRIIGPGQWRGNAWRGCQPETRDQPSWARARAPRTISRTDRMPGETTRLAVDFFYLPRFKPTPGIPGERSSSTKHAYVGRRSWDGTNVEDRRRSDRSSFSQNFLKFLNSDNRDDKR